MAAYSERAGQEEEQDIKEREATAEKGCVRLVKFTAIFITVLVNQVRSSLSALLPNTAQSSEPSLLVFCIRLNNPRVRIQHSFLFRPVPRRLQAPAFFPAQSQICIDWQQTLISGTESEAETMGGAGEAVVYVRSFVFNAVVRL